MYYTAVLYYYHSCCLFSHGFGLDLRRADNIRRQPSKDAFVGWLTEQPAQVPGLNMRPCIHGFIQYRNRRLAAYPFFGVPYLGVRNLEP